jgi:hypothetical protein
MIQYNKDFIEMIKTWMIELTFEWVIDKYLILGESWMAFKQKNAKPKQIFWLTLERFYQKTLSYWSEIDILICC